MEKDVQYPSQLELNYVMMYGRKQIEDFIVF